MSIFNDKTRIDWVIKELKSIQAGESILDAGAGELRYKKHCAHLKYTSQDFGEYSPNVDQTGLQPESWDTSKVDIISDITKTPVKKESFDNVLCSEVLEHVPNPEAAVKELSRILKKGGRLILTTPFCAQTHFAPYFFCTGFSTYWHKEILTKYGFEIIQESPNGNFFEYLGQELLRFPLMVKRYTSLDLMSFLLYIPTIPFVLLTIAISKLSRGSEKQLCFGWHIVARRTK